jgi:hypothetical protein
MTAFTYDDIVRVSANAPELARPGERAWVIGITEEEERVRFRGSHFDAFPPGTVYLVEFEGGDAVDIHESHLSLDDQTESPRPPMGAPD